MRGSSDLWESLANDSQPRTKQNKQKTQTSPIKETLAQARTQAEDQMQRLKGERGGLCGRLRDDHTELGQLAATSRPGDPRLVDAHHRIRDAERRVTQIDDELATLAGDLVDEREVAMALADFDAMWDCLAPREQSRVIELLVERVSMTATVPTFRSPSVRAASRHSPANWPNERRTQHDHHQT